MAKKANKRSTPKELSDLIRLANSVSPEFDLPSPPTDDAEFERLLKREEFSQFRALVGQIAPDKVFMALVGRDAPITGDDAKDLYRMLVDARATLRKAAQVGVASRQFRTEWWGLPHLHPIATIDEHGKFRLRLHPIVSALEGVEIARIRVCKRCGLIFWASRNDSSCCGKACSQQHRKANWSKYSSRYPQYKRGRMRVAHGK
jgi:hypothetical protein